jgi:hypothetical protein
VKRTTLLRNLIPAVIVALVLGASFAISAGAKQGNNPSQSPQCGYGYGNGHTDNESQQGENHESQQAEINDEPCGEVPGDQDGNHGRDKADNGGGGGDNSGDKDRGSANADNDRGGGR